MDDSDPQAPTVRPHWHYDYDAMGNRTSQVDPYGNTTAFAFDEFGRQISRTLPLGVESAEDPDDFIETRVYSETALA